MARVRNIAADELPVGDRRVGADADRALSRECPGAHAIEAGRVPSDLVDLHVAVLLMFVADSRRQQREPVRLEDG